MRSVVDTCAALADESRWDILTRVGERDLSASELATDLAISRQAIARHLTVLESVGLVDTRRVGRQIKYRAIGAELNALARTLASIGAGWEQRLDRLRAAAEATHRADTDTIGGASPR